VTHQRTLIVDGDIYAFQGAAGAEEVTNWGTDDDDGCKWHVIADEASARRYVDRAFDELMESLEGTQLVVTLSDTENWRKSVLPTYKHNRSTARKPIILPQVRQYVREKYAAWQRPTLEGDDLLGILSGMHSKFPGEKVMVTLDKDMSTLAGLHYRPHKSVLGIFEVSQQEADLFHLRQGLAGDPTDGYSGCAGWGMKTAEEFLNEPYMLRQETFTVHKGKKAGVEQTRWVKDPVEVHNFADLWRPLMSLYAKEGVSEADALVQFQVARILRTTDYDFKKKEPILWTPAQL
jgi:DNA polymerase I